MIIMKIIRIREWVPKSSSFKISLDLYMSVLYFPKDIFAPNLDQLRHLNKSLPLCKPQIPYCKMKIFRMIINCNQFSHSVGSDSLRPQESQHARPPCPSPTPGVYSNSCWVGDAIQPSHLLSSPSPPAPNPLQHQGLFQWINCNRAYH